LLTLFAISASASAQDMPLSQILIDGEGWQPIKGPKDIRALGAGKDGSTYVLTADRVACFKRDGSFATQGMPDPKGLRGIAIGGPSGHLFIAARERDQEGRIVEVVPGGKSIRQFKAPGVEHLVVTTNRNIYYTAVEQDGVFLITADGKQRKVVAGLAAPTGLVLWPDQGTLVVADANDKCLWAFRVDPDGSLVNKERYYAVYTPRGEETSGAAGLTIDTAGRVYAATRYGVQVFDPTGRLSGILSQPAKEPPTAIALGGGPDGDTLYVSYGGQLFARKTKAKGVFPKSKD
jgi:sugar lactone lactonase YvrE